MAIITVENLTFSYPVAKEKKILKDINLTINQGEYITLCGRSGSGKTTLLRHLKPVLTPYGKRSGKVLFDNKPIEELDKRSQAASIGYVMQNPDSQIVTDKVWHELAFGLESLGVDQKTIRHKVAEMASFFGIQGWFEKDVSELSGGQKQLLNLASIMVMQPDVLILDEPTSQLDPIAASDFLNTVRKINTELRISVIITEHRLEDIFHASDRVIVMESGQIIACDTPRRVGEILKISDNPMLAALPTPVQVYYSVCGNSGDSALINDKSKGMPDNVPLTVREGAQWLDSILDGKTFKNENTNSLKPRDIECSDPAILMKEVWFRYEKDSPDILKGVDLCVPRQSIFSIVGGNGTGKSTSLKAICNICKPYRGKVIVNGKPIKKYKGNELFSNNLAMLPQDPQSLFVKKSVRLDLEEMIDGKDSESKKLLEKVVEDCEIEELMDSHPFDLSGGEQQRIAMAKVLLCKPQILLLDEPTKGMDNFFKIKFAKILEKLKNQGKTIIMVSHDVEFCAKYSDYVSMFFNGSVIVTASPDKFFSENSFYTTAASRMSRHVFDNAVTNEEVIRLCKKATKG